MASLPLPIYLSTRATIAASNAADDRAPVVLRLGDGKRLTLQPKPPATRGECVDGPRPCPHTACHHHLFAVAGDERPGRRVAGRAPESTLRTVYRLPVVPPSCTLDVADSGAQSVDETGNHLGLKASQVHALEASGLKKLRAMGVTLEALLP